jgi:hypothetical protein
MGIAAAIDGMNTALDTLAGLTVHTDPAEFPTVFPCSVCYLVSGEMSEVSSGFGLGLHTLAVDILLAEADLPTAAAGVEAWPEAVLGALQADPTLGGSIAHVVYPLRYQAGAIEYGVSEHYGLQFRIVVKIA